MMAITEEVEVWLHREPVDFRRQEHLLWIDRPLAPAAACTLTATYAGRIDPRFCYLDIDAGRLPRDWKFHIDAIGTVRRQKNDKTRKAAEAEGELILARLDKSLA